MTEPRNTINQEVGFPEGQLLAHGATSGQCAEISTAFRTGEEMPVTGNTKLDSISDRLTQHSQYGQGGQS